MSRDRKPPIALTDTVADSTRSTAADSLASCDRHILSTRSDRHCEVQRAMSQQKSTATDGRLPAILRNSVKHG